MSRRKIDLSGSDERTFGPELHSSDDDFDFNNFRKYKKEIPELKRIKMNLKRRAYDLKHNLNNIKSGIMGSDGLAIRESLIEDVNSLQRKVAQLERELNELTKGES